MQIFFIPANDEYKVPVERYDSETQNSVLILLSGMGIPMRFYRKIAEQLSINGVTTILFEQRGLGQSSIRASRISDWGYREYLLEDIKAVANWAKQEFPNSIITLSGHSMGGHMALCYGAMHSELIDSLLIIGTGSPYKKNYSFKVRMFLHYLDAATYLSIKLLGLFVGNRLGFGGRESKQFITDWRNLLKSNRYHSDQIDFDFESALNNYKGKVYVITMDKDDYAPTKSVRAVTSKLKSAEIIYTEIESKKDQPKADHFNWARYPQETASIIARWLK